MNRFAARVQAPLRELAQRWRACGRDARGTSAIEFALVSPLVFLLMFATIEIGLDMIVDATVQMAAQAASRAGLTTVLPSNETAAEQAKQIVENYLSPWEKIGGKVTVTLLDYGTYSNVGASNPQQSGGTYGEVVSYNIQLTLPGFMNVTSLLGMPNLVFQRNYLVQNEK
jgi:Flp pilus assembly protein TadG